MAVKLCTVSDFAEELRKLGKSGFTLDGVHQFLKDHPIEPESLRPFLFFRTSHYTRNLIHEAPGGDLSLYAIVWLPGQWTPVHDHGSWGVVGVVQGVLEERSYLSASGAAGSCS